MNNRNAIQFLKHLLERIIIDPQTAKSQIPGFLSSFELSALNKAIEVLQSKPDEDFPVPEEDAPQNGKTPINPPAPISGKDIELDLSSLDHGNFREGVMLCLDFGTAMSKAFATKHDGDELISNIRLPIGSRVRSGQMVYTVPSCIWISNDGAISFGEDAILKSLQSDGQKRQRFDSPKRELIQGLVETPLDKVALSSEINPTDIPFSKGDAITLYLGYLTDLACSELNLKCPGHRHVKRRFALPSWEKDRRSWGERMLGDMLGKAQILADTFHEKWPHTIPILEARRAIDKINALDKIPKQLIDAGVTEPLAAASSRLRKEETARGLVMVVDVGAGTSDFGMFVVAEDPKRAIYRAWPLSGCNESLHQAGDTLDSALLQNILQKANVYPADGAYDLIVANLRFSIRALKEQLFRDGQCAYTLSNGERGAILLDQFLNEPSVKRFSELLSNKFESVLNSAHDSFYQRFDGDKLTVVFTGGGAALPMVKELANGPCGKGGYRLRKTMAPLVPEEFSEDQELSYVYPQLAVAIGGCQPDLIKESDALIEMPGIAHAEWQIGKF